MNINQLRLFNSLAMLENVSKAAELNHVTQGALSKNLSKLEDEIGCNLFNRNGKNIKLNEAGQRFFDCSSSVLESIDDAIEEIKLMNEGNPERIRIGIAGSCFEMSKCVGKFAKDHKNIAFDINGNIGNEELPDINKYDVLIYPDTPKYSKFNGIPLYTEKYYLAVNAYGEYANKTIVSEKDLVYPDVIFFRHTKSVEQAQRILQALSVNVNKSYYVNTRDIHVQLIENNVGIGFVPEGAAHVYRNSKLIKLIPIDDKRFSRPVKMAFKRGKHLSEPAEEFKLFAFDYFGIDQKYLEI